MSKNSIEEEYPVINRAYKLAIELTQRVKNFPRDTRFILGDRILINSYDILEGLIEARYNTSKRGLLLKGNLRLEKLRFQIRLCRDMNIISFRQYGYLSELIDETGKMIGGWLKSRQ